MVHKGSDTGWELQDMNFILELNGYRWCMETY